MSHYVYIIECSSSGLLYKGYSTDVNTRLQQHNDGESLYTSSRGPWIIVYTKEFPNKREALIHEKKLKRCNQQYLRWLIDNYRPGI